VSAALDTERELVLKCRAGHARFFEPLVRAYEPRALRLAVALVGDGEDARDAVQEAFVRAWGALDRFDTERPFGPWFFRVLTNQCRDLLRRRRRRFRTESLDLAALQVVSAEEAPDAAVERVARAERLWQALARVSPAHREILVLKEFEDLPYPAIAVALGVPEGTVASRLYHARRALRSALEAQEGRVPVQEEVT
jgi:RNA polymerase sigma factor (sigma-70 family)